MEKDVMEKPQKKDRNFSIVVPNSLYGNLRVMAFHTEMSLGGICRILLQVITPQIFRRLKEKSESTGKGIVTLAREILLDGLK